MKRTGISADIYCEYLLPTFDNFTCSHLAEILDCSHDAASDALRGHSLKPRALWDRVRPHCPLERRRRGAMILDDSVLDKNFSKKDRERMSPMEWRRAQGHHRRWCGELASL